MRVFRLASAILLVLCRIDAAVSRVSVVVPMRDGIGLATDIYRGSFEGKRPVLLMRTPYNKMGAQATAERFAREGYAVVVQDCRGRYASAGAFVPYNNEGQDGHDTLDWIQAQPWSNGQAGMWGASYVGAVQWQAAVEQGPGLAVLAPTATWTSFYRNIYLGGAARLALISQAAASLFGPPAGVSQPVDWGKTLLHLPLSRMEDAIGWRIPWLSGILAHNRPDGYWRRLDLTRDIEVLKLPAQHTVGYYDFFCREVVSSFARLLSSAANRQNQQLILGPWDHGTIGKRHVGEVDFGANAQLDHVEENLRWFNRFLKPTTEAAFAPVRYFSMGDNEWHTAQAWPPSDATLASFYLHSSGRANTRKGNGQLNESAPSRPENADTFLADPANPVRAVPLGTAASSNIASWGPVNHAVASDREDVLVYTSAPLSAHLTFAGPLRAEVYGSADTPDADWVIKLVDVRPDGFEQNLAVGILRSSFREGDMNHAPLSPARIYKFDVDLGHAAARLDRNHRLRVEIAGSHFPLYERNTNTGEGPASIRSVVARQQVMHSRQYPSRLILPVLKGKLKVN